MNGKGGGGALRKGVGSSPRVTPCLQLAGKNKRVGGGCTGVAAGLLMVCKQRICFMWLCDVCFWLCVNV